MAYEFYVSIVGTKQGKFKGESARKGHKDKVAGLKYSYALDTPRDPATGQASGKRTHHPVTFVKEWGASTPQFFQALVTNEVLKSVRFEFVRTDSAGAEEVFHTVTLTNASVSEIRQYTGDTERAQGDKMELEAVSLTYQTISIENKLGKTVASDDWLQ